MAEQDEATENEDPAVDQMWETALLEINSISVTEENWKSQPLPLARIKKIMKQEEIIMRMLSATASGETDAAPADRDDTAERPRFMIASEAPLVLGKACELMARDLAVRAWRETERGKRRTLQKHDVYTAVGKSDVYDFLIDIVPRSGTAAVEGSPPPPAAVPPPQMQGTGVPPPMYPHAAAMLGMNPAMMAAAGMGLPNPVMQTMMQTMTAAAAGMPTTGLTAAGAAAPVVGPTVTTESMEPAEPTDYAQIEQEMMDDDYPPDFDTQQQDQQRQLQQAAAQAALASGMVVAPQLALGCDNGASLLVATNQIPDPSAAAPGPPSPATDGTL